MALIGQAAAPSPSSDTDPARRTEDELLVIRCQLGEPAAFDELIHRWEEPLWRYARRVTGHDDAADDVTQDVWVRVIRGIGRLRDGERLRAWLFGIARRTLMDRLRVKYAAPPPSDVDVNVLAAVDAGAEELEADLAAVQEELSRLPVTERDVLSLFYLEELSLQEVAEVLDVPVGTVKSRLFRARQLLRREMAAREDRR
jgi:RNA polymerase sigma-70 factor (ECF subfamily)